VKSMSEVGETVEFFSCQFERRTTMPAPDVHPTTNLLQQALLKDVLGFRQTVQACKISPYLTRSCWPVQMPGGTSLTLYLHRHSCPLTDQNIEN
jgi:hypothetical protein